MAELPPPMPPDVRKMNSAIIDAVVGAITAGMPASRALALAGDTLSGLAGELRNIAILGEAVPPEQTTDGRPGLRISSEHPLIADLEVLAQRHGLIGCVLVGFDAKSERVSTTAASKSPLFLDAMKTLGDRILAKIDDGELDPT